MNRARIREQYYAHTTWSIRCTPQTLFLPSRSPPFRGCKLTLGRGTRFLEPALDFAPNSWGNGHGVDGACRDASHALTFGVSICSSCRACLQRISQLLCYGDCWIMGVSWDSLFAKMGKLYIAMGAFCG